MTTRISLRVAGVLLAAVVLGGCSKVTKENYDKLKVGMDYSEITQIIGNPEHCEEAMGAKSCDWGDDDVGISVKFVADKAVFFSNQGL